jgi:hypothetical protein
MHVSFVRLDVCALLASGSCPNVRTVLGSFLGVSPNTS